MQSEGRCFGIVLTQRLWWSEAIKGRVKVFHFPPQKRPALSKLRKGDTCIVYLTDAKCIVGEFKVEDVKLVTAKEFEQYRDMAYEIPKAPFPTGKGKSWIIVFSELRIYSVEIPKSSVPKLSQWILIRIYLCQRKTLRYTRVREEGGVQGGLSSEVRA